MERYILKLIFWRRKNPPLGEDTLRIIKTRTWRKFSRNLEGGHLFCAMPHLKHCKSSEYPKNIDATRYRLQGSAFAESPLAKMLKCCPKYPLNIRQCAKTHRTIFAEALWLKIDPAIAYGSSQPAVPIGSNNSRLRGSLNSCNFFCRSL